MNDHEDVDAARGTTDNSDLDRQDRVEKWRTAAVVGFIIIAAVVLFLGGRATNRAQSQADNEASQKYTLAQQVAAACAMKESSDDLGGLCKSADQIVKEGPSGSEGPAGPPGPAGPQGPLGPKGEDGDRGLQGVMGPNGPQGIAGTDGQNGEPGATGAQGDPGVAGADGATGATGPEGPAGPAGKDGTNGTNGSDGRGITSVECVDDDTANGSHWIITYTDGTTQTSDGPCRTKDVGPPLPVG